MTSLTRFESNDGIELVIDTITGEAFATVSGYSRMSGKANSTIHERTSRLADSKLAETLTSIGLKTSRLIPANIVGKWLIKDNPELAEKMLDAGATVYMHQLAGYKVTSTAIEQPKTTADIFLMVAQQFKEQELKLAAMQAKTLEIENKLEEQQLHIAGLDAELGRHQNSEGHYYTVIGYANIHGLKMGSEQAKGLGKRCSNYCKQNGIKKEEIHDTMWGLIGSYPEAILQFIFRQQNLI
jgi:hypothetical protein